MKKGILATKVGMTQIFNEDGVLTPVTVLLDVYKRQGALAGSRSPGLPVSPWPCGVLF